MPLRLEPDDAVFVVFRKAAAAPARALPEPVETELATIAGPWDVAFQAGRGAPATVRLRSAAAPGARAPIRGSSISPERRTYTKTVEAPGEWFKPGAQLWLDLGDVKNLAEVTVNGRPLGIVWKTPFRVDVTAALKPGPNTLEIKVANLWVNRLIGDKQPGVTKTYTYTAVEFYKADSPLLPSGLLGPVKIVRWE